MATKPTRSQLLAYIRDNYPDVYGLLSVNAEVREVLLTAAERKYTPTRLQSALAATTWWKKTAATAREWDAAYAQDKATGDALLRQTRTEIATQAARLGIPLTAEQVARYALNVRRLGWTPQEVQQSIGARFRQSTASEGLGTATVDSLRALSAEYGVSLSEHVLTATTRRILSGQEDIDAFRSYLTEQAESLFPGLKEALARGQTVRQYFDPYVQTASRVLGINPNEVDLSDNRWRRALVQIDPKTGDRVPMSLDEWEADLKTNDLYGYDRTANGRRERDQFVGAFSNILGIR